MVRYQAIPDVSYLWSLHGACKVLSVSCRCSHKTFTILYPDIINTSWLDLMYSYKIAVRDQGSPVQPVPRIVFPALLKIYTGLGTRGAK
jgi:hypothetical protein